LQSQQWRREKPNSWLFQGGRRGIYTPPPLKSDRYSHLHRLKPDLTPAIAGLKSLALARNSRTKSRFATEGFSPQILGSPAKAGPRTG
jgi:hypothetical protein